MFQYVLGRREETVNKRTNLGTIQHRVFETVAKVKIAKDAGHEFMEDDILGNVTVEGFEVDNHIPALFDHYRKKFDYNDWNDNDIKELFRWTDIVRGSKLWPASYKIVSPEMKFEFPIKKDWAAWEFEIDGKKVQGYLGLKGVIDLVLEHDSEFYEIVDWKTGRRKNWATGQIKTPEYLQTDPQLMIYYYAIRQLFPAVPTLMTSIYYLDYGGIFTPHFSDDILPDVENMLKKRFTHIKKNKKPAMIPRDRRWQCTKFCHFGKNTFEGTNVKPMVEFRSGQVTPKGKTMTMCEQMRFEIERKGLDRSCEEYKNPTFKMKVIE
jgi:hypothetical protein